MHDVGKKYDSCDIMCKSVSVPDTVIDNVLGQNSGAESSIAALWLFSIQGLRFRLLSEYFPVCF